MELRASTSPASILLVNLSSLPILGNRPIYPLGLITLASSLRDLGHRVELVDFVEHPGYVENLDWLIPRHDVIGLSIRDVDPIDMTQGSFVGDYIKMTARIRARVSCEGYHPLYIGGGAGMTLFSKPLKAALHLDQVILGEGEQALSDLACGTKNGKLQNYVRIGDSKFGARQVCHSHPLLSSYLKTKQIEIGVETRRRKCVKKCNYCPYAYVDERQLGTFKDLGILREEIHRLYENGVRQIFFTDAVFNNELAFAKSVCRLLASLSLKDLSWSAYFTPSSFDEELAECVSGSNNGNLIFSPDSFDDLSMKKMGKMYTMRHVLRCKSYCEKYDLNDLWVLLFGGPGESDTTIVNSARVANSQFGPEKINFQIGVRVLPHTDIARQLNLCEDFLLRPIFYPLREGLFDSVFRNFDSCFFPEKEFLRYMALRAYAGRLEKIPIENPIDRKLNHLLAVSE